MYSGKENLTALLIENGADIDLKANDGRTAIEMAKEKGNFNSCLFKITCFTFTWFAGYSKIVRLLKKAKSACN